MKTLIGYILSGVGIIALALSEEKVKAAISIKFLQAIPSNVIWVIGGIFIAAGIITLMLSNSSGSSSNVKQAKEEVPIYEGEGKHRKIVGYRKA